VADKRDLPCGLCDVFGSERVTLLRWHARLFPPILLPLLPWSFLLLPLLSPLVILNLPQSSSSSSPPYFDNLWSSCEINCRALIFSLFQKITSIMSAHNKPLETVITKLNGPHLKERRHSKTQSAFNYDNTSSNLAATTMRNELKRLVDTAPPDARDVQAPNSLDEYLLICANRSSELRWTISSLCSSDTSATRQRETKCNIPIEHSILTA